MSEWIMYCSEKDRGAVMGALAGLDGDAVALLATSADDLRLKVAQSDPGDLGVMVGPVADGVSGINVAAALANDGNARCVALAQGEVSGSLRSRAARAGVDVVIDLSELPSSPGLEAGREEARDGGRVCPPPAAPAPDCAPLPAQGMALSQRSASSRRAPVLVVCSGRGGVGKTAVAVTLSCVAARWGMRACLLDLDLSCGNAASCFGASGKSDLSALAGAGEVTPELLRRTALGVAPSVSLLGPCDRPENAELAWPYVGGVIEWAAGEFDLVVIDTSTTFTDAVAQAVQEADRLVIVSDGRSGSVASLARMSGLAIRLGVARTRVVRLENRSDPREKINYALGRAEVGLEAARVYRIFDGGAEVTDLLAAGQAYDLSEPGYPFSDSAATTLAQMLAELGRLPERDEARRAAEGTRAGRLRSLFGLRREAR